MLATSWRYAFLVCYAGLDFRGQTIGQALRFARVKALYSELTILVMRPWTVFKLACLFGLRTAFIFFLTWTELVKATIYLHFNLFWKMLTLPLRLLTAIWRERQLEMHLHDVQGELENLTRDRMQLQQHLQTAIREHKMMELILEDLEDEHDKAISEIQLLQDQLQELKNENLRLLEVQGKGYWNFTSKDDAGSSHISGFSDDKHGTSYGIPSWKPGYDGSGIILQELMMHRNTLGDESKTTSELLKLLKPELSPGGPIHLVGRNLETSEVVDQRRGTAVTQSLFSAVLSLLVGIIIWEAEQPCMPLVVALFTVVGMSLKSVVQFFSTIKNKPASDAVALLSLNWFILGTLAYPTLPIVAPLASRITDRAVRLMGISSS
ncbi:coiled-coil protein [Parasponia andersonii]|uniref:Coiled-coil protein n=1 Tax=Parasponia andersonii TaxID=3476 RepID=A0A2P5D5F3_PARAD|nr:coiled-coil protein [Parasponia andersonii]